MPDSFVIDPGDQSKYGRQACVFGVKKTTYREVKTLFITRGPPCKSLNHLQMMTKNKFHLSFGEFILGFVEGDFIHCTMGFITIMALHWSLVVVSYMFHVHSWGNDAI